MSRAKDPAKRARLKRNRDFRKRMRRKQRKADAEEFGGSDPGTTYQQRNTNLRSLGYSSYSVYLASAQWRGIRKSVLGRRGPTCESCDDEGSTIHHIDYSVDTLIGKRFSKLVVLCSRCHRFIEFDDNGRKCSPTVANQRLRNLSLGRLAG